MHAGVNFFGLKKKLYENFDSTIARLKEIGYTSAEVCVMFGEAEISQKNSGMSKELTDIFNAGVWHYKTAPEKIAKLRTAGLQVVSVHVMGNPERPLDELIPYMISFGKEYQITYFVISFNQTLEGMKKMASVTKKVSEELAKEGLTFVYHNHEPECIETDGVNALDFILDECPQLMMELDVGWAQFGGSDPVALLKKYKHRMPLIHFKDISEDACPENREVCFRAIGEGTIPLKEIIDEVKTGGIMEEGLIVDQDDSIGDLLDDLETGLNHLINYMKKNR